MRRKLLILGLLGVAILVSGCSLKMAGGGVMASRLGPQMVEFGFTYDGTTMPGRFEGSYRDPNFSERAAARGGGLHLRGDGVVYGFDDNGDGFDECMFADVDYISINPTFPGGGLLFWLACDFGEPGPSAGDNLSIFILSGPYQDYFNSGTILAGNIQDLD